MKEIVRFDVSDVTVIHVCLFIFFLKRHESMKQRVIFFVKLVSLDRKSELSVFIQLTAECHFWKAVFSLQVSSV